MSKKIVLKAELNCEKCKRRAMTTVAGVPGVDSVHFDSKDNKFTVIGDADPVEITARLRRFGSSEIVSVGPAKEEKKDDKKKEEPKKDEKKKEEKKDSLTPSNVVLYVPPGWDPHYYRDPHHYYNDSHHYGDTRHYDPHYYGGYDDYWSDENPSACAIS